MYYLMLIQHVFLLFVNWKMTKEELDVAKFNLIAIYMKELIKIMFILNHTFRFHYLILLIEMKNILKKNNEYSSTFFYCISIFF